MTTHKKTLKIVILGDSGVGKTSIMNCYSTGKFTGQYKATIGADFLSKDAIVTDSLGQRHYVTLQIWDTAGQERFQSLGMAFYRGADGAILVYDITDPESLEHLERWRREFINQIGIGGGVHHYGPPFPFVVLGNKCDKEAVRKIPGYAAEEWCARGNPAIGDETPLQHLETSAKTAVNVEEAFQTIAGLAIEYEDYKRRSQPQLFVPPPNSSNGPTIDLRRQDSSFNERRNDTCC
jgi:Ras-related protein Rab-7A